LAPPGSSSSTIIPAGTLPPGRYDRRLTERLIEAGKLLDIDVDDDIIIGYGRGRYCSFADKSLIPR